MLGDRSRIVEQNMERYALNGVSDLSRLLHWLIDIRLPRSQWKIDPELAMRSCESSRARCGEKSREMSSVRDNEPLSGRHVSHTCSR